MSDELFAYMRREELTVLASLEGTTPKHHHTDWDGPLERYKRRGLVWGMRAHKRCGQDENPATWYGLTEKGRERLAALRAAAPSPVGQA